MQPIGRGSQYGVIRSVNPVLANGRVLAPTLHTSRLGKAISILRDSQFNTLIVATENGHTIPQKGSKLGSPHIRSNGYQKGYIISTEYSDLQGIDLPPGE